MPGPQPPSAAPRAARTRTLVVVRHAQAESAAPSDAERPLTGAGLADAAALGAWLAEQGVVPTGALVSDATRARQTWAALAEGAAWSPGEDAVDVDPALYAAGEDGALDLVRATDEDRTSLVVVGHNPTVAVLAQLLDDGEGDPEVATAMLGGFPTATAAVFELDGPWADLAPGRARLSAFHVGRA